jgi:hypothetical protein
MEAKTGNGVAPGTASAVYGGFLLLSRGPRVRNPFPGVKALGGSQKPSTPGVQSFHTPLMSSILVGTASVGEHGF